MEKDDTGKTVWMNLSKAIKDDLLPNLRERYAPRDRAGKSRMLDELCEESLSEPKSAVDRRVAANIAA